MPSINCQIIAHNSEEYLCAVALRHEVLRRPLGLTYSAEQLAAESDQIHVVGFDGNVLVGCLILQPSGTDKLKMRQVAVLPTRQRQGIGVQLCRYAEQIAIARGATLLYCHARNTAVAFYEHLGYECVGDMFEEVSIPHYLMQKCVEEP